MQDIEEYERLLSQRFATDPSLRKQADDAVQRPQARLEDLYRKLYGKEPGEPPED